MVHCAKCGASISAAARFCPKCGQAVGSLKATQQPVTRLSSSGAAACRYHPQAAVAGVCVDCGNAFCDECAVPIVRHGMICLDCGAVFARKRLRQAYWAAGIGVPFSIGLTASVIAVGDWWAAPFTLVAYSYVFPAVFFGWHYGGRVWVWLFKFTDYFHGMAGFIAALIALAIRLTAAIYIGIFGGGIVQFLRYRKLLALHQAVTAPASAQLPLSQEAAAPAGEAELPPRIPGFRPNRAMIAVALAVIVLIGGVWVWVKRQAPGREQMSVHLWQAFVGGKAAYTDATETGGPCKVVVSIPYDFGGEFREGLARVANARKFAGYQQMMLDHFGFINPAGDVVIPLRFDDVEDFHEGLAAFGIREHKGGRIGSVLSRFGYIDRSGKIAIPARFERAFPFSEGVAVVRTGNTWAYIDSRGKILFTFSGKSATSFSESVAAVQSANGWGYIDHTGRFAIAPTFQFASDYHGGLAPVEVGRKWGAIDKSGRLVIPAQFDQLEPFADGLAKFTNTRSLGGGPYVEMKSGFIDRSGAAVIEAAYDEAQGFSEGLAAVQKGRKWGFVDKSGAAVIACQYDGATPFSGGVAEVATAGRWMYIDRAGKQLCLSGRRWGGD